MQRCVRGLGGFVNQCIRPAHGARGGEDGGQGTRNNVPAKYNRGRSKRKGETGHVGDEEP